MKKLHDQLKEKTKNLHQKAHQISYIQALFQDNVPKVSYQTHLRVLAVIYGTLENQIKKLQSPEISPFTQNYIHKLPLIMKDLEILKAAGAKDLIPAIREALIAVDKILLYSGLDPHKLIGYLYTLDGSLNGGLILARHISDTLNGNESRAVNFFSIHKENQNKFWPAFTKALNSETLKLDKQQSIIEGAIEMFHSLMRIFEKLHPVRPESLGRHVSTLNPEAGDHSLPDKPAEIEAAIKAAHKNWKAFPYFELLFGERGLRFAVSDSAWLVKLNCMPPETARRQAFWLAEFLAKAAMPTITFEMQLQYLCEELKKQNNNADYTQLSELKAVFEQKRKKIQTLADAKKNYEIFSNICKANNVLPDSFPAKIEVVITSSIADAQNGIPEAKQSLKDKLTNTKLFNTKQIKSINQSFNKFEELI